MIILNKRAMKGVRTDNSPRLGKARSREHGVVRSVSSEAGAASSRHAGATAGSHCATATTRSQVYPGGVSSALGLETAHYSRACRMAEGQRQKRGEHKMSASGLDPALM